MEHSQTQGGASSAEPQSNDPTAILRSPDYLRLLPLCAGLGIVVSALGFAFVHLFLHVQTWLYESTPKALGLAPTPGWWGFPFLAAGGLLVGLALRYLPGNGGHSPADPFTPAQPEVRALPGIVVAALVSLGCGAVLGPEAPLIALGGGLGALAVQTVARRTPAQFIPVVGLAGSVASLGTIFGSPIVAAMFVIEAVGLGGGLLTVAIVPGLLAAGIGSLVFIGLGRWSGLGSASLVVPGIPHFVRPDLPQLGWSVMLGVVAPFVVWAVRAGALLLRPRLARIGVAGPVLAGLGVGAMALAFNQATGRPITDVLFSGQSTIGPLVSGQASWTLGALGLLLVCKAVAYSLSLSSFRGGPVFPALLVGTAGGLLAAHLPGMGVVPGIAAGMGGTTAAMLGLPVASVLFPSLLLLSSGLGVAPLVIVAVVASFMTTRFLPLPTGRDARSAPVPAAR